LCVKLPTGEVGVELGTRVEGQADTQTVTGPGAAKHAAAKPMLAGYAAVRKNDPAAYAAAFCAGGFAMPFPAGEGGKTVVAHPGNVRALSGTLLKAVGHSMRAKTLQVREVCLIVRGNAALGGCRVAFERPDGTTDSVYDTWLLVKHKGTWGLVGILPPTVGIRLGLGR
jgi:hypothetical protein